MEPTLIIIGAGTAGLAAGCYARMNGYRTTILEMARTPGGLCTSWQRQGYRFDGSVAGLAGSGPGSPLYRLWEELGVAAYCPLTYGESFGQIVDVDGRTTTIYTDIDRAEARLLAGFPAEARAIREFAGALRSLLDLDIPFSDARGWQAVKQAWSTAVVSARHLPALLRYGNLTIRQFCARIHDPALVTVFHNLVHFGGPDVPLLTVLLPLAYAHRKLAGIPLQGWLAFARAIERRYLELGGVVRYQARVQRLVVEGGAVKGVLLADGSVVAADRVLSAADGRFSQSLLLGRAEGDTRQPFRAEDLSDQPVQVNLGVAARPFEGTVTYILPQPLTAAGRAQARVTVHSSLADGGAAPPGASALTAFLDSDYAWWQALAADRERYRAEKERCAAVVIETLASHYPEIAAQIEVVDVSTPLTRERYTGNWMGAMQARRPGRSMITALLQGGPQYAVKGVRGLYLAGQWVEAWGGITTAARSGRNAVQAMCRADGKRFVTTTP